MAGRSLAYIHPSRGQRVALALARTDERALEFASRRLRAQSALNTAHAQRQEAHQPETAAALASLTIAFRGTPGSATSV